MKQVSKTNSCKKNNIIEKTGIEKKEEKVSDIERLNILVKLDPWPTAGVDLFVYTEKNSILVMDYYSCYP